MSEVGISSVEMSMNIKQRIKGSVGKPFPGVDYRISDDGELQISGDIMHYAELKNGELYLRDYDYFNSGDAAIKDENGYYYIQGRANEIIISNNGDRIIADTIEKKFEIPHAESYCLFGVHKDEHSEIILIINPKKEISPEQHAEMLQAINNTNQALPLTEKLTKAYLTPVVLAPMPGTKVRRNFVNNLYLKKEIELIAIQLS
jgi:long-chain acyl-CoA synthetase